MVTEREREIPASQRILKHAGKSRRPLSSKSAARVWESTARSRGTDGHQGAERGGVLRPESVNLVVAVRCDVQHLKKEGVMM